MSKMYEFPLREKSAKRDFMKSFGHSARHGVALYQKYIFSQLYSIRTSTYVKLIRHSRQFIIIIQPAHVTLLKLLSTRRQTQAGHYLPL
jgi:hypothetical protein